MPRTPESPLRCIGIVNRGEPAVRFLAALDALRREESEAPMAVALYTDADVDSLYVRSADAAVRIGEGRRAYLDADAVIAGLKAGLCDAAWLGWGFASEDADFAGALEAAGITLLAPRPETMRRLGDKIAAKQLAEACAVPVAPWAVVDDAEAAAEAAERVGFPLMLKAAGGGGGRGIRRVEAPGELAAAFKAARQEADRSFHGGGIFVECCVESARHVEVQVLGDGEGAVRVLGVRECSLQRRRQKIIEECPSPGLSPAAEQVLIGAARRLCGAVRYRSAGTVEFLYDEAADAAYFLEVNTRLQVEHPVTEEVFGVDLVRAQIDLARGRPLPPDARARGWAIEARVCAEDPQRGFVPAPGRLLRFVSPTGPGLRVDTGFAEGESISPDFDPLVAKIIAWGPTRQAALGRLAHALDRTRVIVDGGTTNLNFLRALLAREDVRRGAFDIGFVERLPIDPPEGAGVAVLAAAVDRFLADGDRAPERGVDRHRVEAGEPVDVYRIGRHRFRIVHPDGDVTVRYEGDGPYQHWLTLAGGRYRVERAPGDLTYVIDGTAHRVAAASGGAVLAPSAAMVLEVPVAVGDVVPAGGCVAVLESMKMEVRVDAPRAGVVREIRIAPGSQVRAGQPMVLLELDGAADAEPPSTGARVPWQSRPPRPAAAAERIRAAFVGWDAAPEALAVDAERAALDDIPRLLEVFADVAELFERRPRDGVDGTAEVVSPSVLMETLLRRGPDALGERARKALARALRHHGIDDLGAGEVRAEALERLGRAQGGLSTTVPVAARLLERLEAAPSGRLVERLCGLDPMRFGAVREAADRARYLLVDRVALHALTRRGEARAEEMLQRLRADDLTWAEFIAAPESLVPGLAPEAAGGCPVAAEGVARRLEWTGGDMPIERLDLGDRPAFRVGPGAQAVVCVTARVDEVDAILDAAAALPPTRRLDLVLVPPGPAAVEDAMEQAVEAARPDGLTRPPWGEVCILIIRGPHYPRVRRFYADGVERIDRTDVMPSTARRLDLDRLARFDFQRLPSDDDVVLFFARGAQQTDDVRLLAFGEVRSLDRSEGPPLRLPHVDRVFHAAVRAIEAARKVHDPQRRWQWNRITLRVVPPVPFSLSLMRGYAGRLAPAARRIGLEKLVVRARFSGPDAPDGLCDLSIYDRSGHRLEFVLKPASHAPLEPTTRYERALVAARRRNMVHPYEIVRMLEGRRDLPPSRFTELDLDGERLVAVDRPRGENSAAVVVGRLESRPEERPGHVFARVLLVSDPTRRMGALAEPECRRIIAALDLAEAEGLPVEWVAISAGARIDWDTGTENLDWTARVLGRIVRFTQGGGQIDLVVPGVCVGAQAYWNAEATMMMHTRGLLVMTDRGAMVLTGKRALDASGCVSAEDDLALGGYTAVMGPNGQAQAHATDLARAYRLLYRYHGHTYVAPGERRPRRLTDLADPTDRDVTVDPYPEEAGHGFARVGELFSTTHNPDRKRPFAVRPILRAVVDRDCAPVERWSAWRGAETAVVWEARIGGFGAMVIGIENQPLSRVGQLSADGPDRLAGGTLYPQASRKVARALNAASGRRPVVVLANLSGFDGSPESLGQWQLEYGAEIGRAVVNFDGPIVFVVLSRYHGGAYVVFSKSLNPRLVAVAVEGSYASVIGGAPAAAVVFARDVRRRATELGGGEGARSAALAEIAARFDGVHTVERARAVGSIDDIVEARALRPFVIERLAADYAEHGPG